MVMFGPNVGELVGSMVGSMVGWEEMNAYVGSIVGSSVGYDELGLLSIFMVPNRLEFAYCVCTVCIVHLCDD